MMGEKRLLYVPYLVTTPSLPTGDDTRRPCSSFLLDRLIIIYPSTRYYYHLLQVRLTPKSRPEVTMVVSLFSFFSSSFFLRYTKLLRGGPGTKSIGHATLGRWAEHDKQPNHAADRRGNKMRTSQEGI